MAAVDDRNWGAQPWRFGRAGITRLEAEQDRWFLWLPVAFGVGIAIYIQAGIEPSLLAVTALAIGAIVLRLAGGAGIAGFLVTTTLLAIALGVFAARVRTEVVRAPVLERQIGPVEVRGWVELVEPRPSRGQRITIWPVAMERMAPADLPVKVRVRTRDAVAGLKPGDSVRLRAMLGPPAGPSFPGDFDFARLAFFQQLGGIGIATGRVVKIDPDGEMPLWLVWRSGVETWRQGIGARITAALPGETGAIANALITGERGAISETTNQAYRDSGLFHILSISGLHMVIMAGAVFFVVRLVLAAIPALALRHPIKKWAAASAIAGAFAYLVISGSAFATVRSAIMITIIFGAVILDRPALALRNVALAALIILVLYPESLFDAGFQMS
ncbi:MAG: ComEC/Rec2 family competence protein, partial [Hyphomicrobiales bacterium]|nr:ComEC/Rec2 family competence protein [Hyphomicrobiales bacterium]